METAVQDAENDVTISGENIKKVTGPNTRIHPFKNTMFGYYRSDYEPAQTDDCFS